jgi:hypothetical protein
VVALDPVIGVPVDAVPRHRQEIFQHRRVHGRLIGGDLDGRDLGRADRPQSRWSKAVTANATAPSWAISNGCFIRKHQVGYLLGLVDLDVVAGARKQE